MAGLIVSGVVAAALATAGVVAWWFRRRTESGVVAGRTPGDAELDRVALERAADDGMAPASDARDERQVDDALPGSNGVVRGLAGIL